MMQKDGIGSTLMGAMAPPTPFLDDTLMDLWDVMPFTEGTPKWKSLQMVPWIGRALYARGTEAGQTATRNREKGNLYDDVRAAIRSGNSSDLSQARAAIREYNQGKTGDDRITVSAVSRQISNERKKMREEARR